jgi:aspartyl-tRNA(Asn)/glutamyl-tRNA(Gln) amidotransferase subunit C
LRDDALPIEHIANLARIDLTPAEVELFRGQLGDIIEYFDQLREVNTDGVEPTTHAVPLNTVMRPDEIILSLPAEDILGIAPVTETGLIRIPPVFPGDSEE